MTNDQVDALDTTLTAAIASAATAIDRQITAAMRAGRAFDALYVALDGAGGCELVTFEAALNLVACCFPYPRILDETDPGHVHVMLRWLDGQGFSFGQHRYAGPLQAQARRDEQTRREELRRFAAEHPEFAAAPTLRVVPGGRNG